MKRFIQLFALIVVVNLSFADEIATPSLQAKPEETQTEVDMQAKAIGINYSHLERMALGGQQNALAVIVALTFDGGAAEGMETDKIIILCRAPADEVASVLKIYSPEFRASLIERMKKQFLFINGDKKSVSDEFDRRFGSLTENKPEENKKQNKSEMATPRKPSD